jgi:hypothetical protein
LVGNRGFRITRIGVPVGSDEIEQNLRQSTLIALFGKNDIPGGRKERRSLLATGRD